MLLRRRSKADAVTAASDLALSLAPTPWNIEEFVRNVGDHLGIRIELAESHTLPLDFNGVFTQDVEGNGLIQYRAGASPRQRDMIVLHEVGHLLLDHPEDPHGGVRSMLAPAVSDALIARFLGRSVYEDIHEVEAETFATNLAAHAHASPLRRPDQLTSRLR